MRVVIIGGGVMGCATALALTARGARDVTVLERAVPGAEASSAAAGMLAPEIESADPSWIAAREAYVGWSEELRGSTVDIGFRRSGAIVVARTDRELEEIGGTRFDARAIEPSLAADVIGGRYLPNEAQVDPPQLLRALVVAIARAGVVVRSGTTVSSLAVSNGRCVGVNLAGELLEADAVVLAAGSWSSLVPGVPAEVPTVRPIRGQLVQLEERPPQLRTIVFSGHGYVVPRGDGRVICGSTMEDVGHRREVTAAGVKSILDDALAIVPALGSAELVRSWCNFRPSAAGGAPLVGASPLPGLFLATGHHRNGILLAKVTAEAVAGAVLLGRLTMSRSLRDSMPTGLGDIPSIHSIWGTFESASIESDFRKEDFKVSIRRYVRFSVPLSVVAFLAYGLHDALVVPEILTTAWLIRYVVFAPIGLLLIFLVLRNEKPERHPPLMLLFGVAVNLVVIWIGALSPPAGFFIYTGYALVFVTVGPFLARMNVKTQLVYALISLALYNGFDLIAHAALYIRISLNVTMLTLGTIGLLAARQLELQARLQFLQRRVILQQMNALDDERKKSESLLLNVLPRRIADRLKENPGVIADRFDEATVLFSDVVGFTQLSARLEPDALVRRLDAIFTRFDEIAGQLGLEKIKTIGDAYMVAGGLPIARADHVESVCEMAIRMRDCMAEIDPDVAIRIGLHTGPVVAGVIGTKKFIYDVWGDTVNTASRMESHGVPGKIQVSAAVHATVGHLFFFEERGEIEVKGKGPMKTFLLLARREIESERKATLPLSRPAE